MRRMFPAEAPFASRCAGAARTSKIIMVFDAAVRNQPRFNNRRTLVLTGERAGRSPLPPGERPTRCTRRIAPTSGMGDPGVD
jgi:hypothetical protein